MKNMEDILKQINQIKNKMETLSKQLKDIKIKGISDSNKTTAVFSGDGKILDYFIEGYEIDDNLKNELIEAINNGIKKAEKLRKESRKEIAGNLSLPDIPGIFND